MYSEVAIKIGGLEAYDSVAHTAPYQQVTCGYMRDGVTYIVGPNFLVAPRD